MEKKKSISHSLNLSQDLMPSTKRLNTNILKTKRVSIVTSEWHVSHKALKPRENGELKLLLVLKRTTSLVTLTLLRYTPVSSFIP